MCRLNGKALMTVSAMRSEYLLDGVLVVEGLPMGLSVDAVIEVCAQLIKGGFGGVLALNDGDTVRLGSGLSAAIRRVAPTPGAKHGQIIARIVDEGVPKPPMPSAAHQAFGDRLVQMSPQAMPSRTPPVGSGAAVTKLLLWGVAAAMVVSTWMLFPSAVRHEGTVQQTDPLRDNSFARVTPRTRHCGSASTTRPAASESFRFPKHLLGMQWGAGLNEGLRS